MRFCQPHWNDLREAIEERGLGALIASSGERAAENIARELAGEGSADTYDPLMSAMFAVFNNAVHAFADDFARFAMVESVCPLCVGNAMEEESDYAGETWDDLRLFLASPPVVGPFDQWIIAAADEQMETARERLAGD